MKSTKNEKSSQISSLAFICLAILCFYLSYNGLHKSTSLFIHGHSTFGTVIANQIQSDIKRTITCPIVAYKNSAGSTIKFISQDCYHTAVFSWLPVPFFTNRYEINAHVTLLCDQNSCEIKSLSVLLFQPLVFFLLGVGFMYFSRKI